MSVWKPLSHLFAISSCIFLSSYATFVNFSINIVASYSDLGLKWVRFNPKEILYAPYIQLFFHRHRNMRVKPCLCTCIDLSTHANLMSWANFLTLSIFDLTWDTYNSSILRREMALKILFPVLCDYNYVWHRVMTRDVRFGLKRGQIGPKSEKSGTFF